MLILICLVIGLVCFALAALKTNSPLDLTATGLFFWLVTLVIPMARC